MSLENSDSEFEKLKELLIGDELEQIIQLKSKLKELASQSNDEELIAAKVLPLFDRVLLERIRNKDKKTIAILSDYLADIITEASQKNPEALSRSLQSILSSAVSKEISSNKDAMIDTLYPIMGGMVSKYVSSAIKELIENMNRKIDDGLSLDRYKRKIKSKLTGVSETELLLQEISEAHILSLFVIQKESGLLISEAHWRDNQISDPHMVASMASAIKNFVNDWIQKSEKQAEVQLLSYGSSTLYIESAGSVYLVAFLNAEPDQEQRMEINDFFASLIKDYFDLFQNFNGDDSSKEVKSLTNQIQSYLDTQDNYPAQKENKPRSNYAKYFALLLLALFLVALLYILKNSITEYSITSEIREKTKYAIDIDINNEYILAKGSVDNFSDLQAIEKIISRRSQKSIINHITIPMTKIGKIFHDKEKRIDANITQLSKHILQLKEKLTQANQTVNSLSDKLEKERVESSEKIEQLLTKEKEVKRLTNLKETLLIKLKQNFMHTPYFYPENGTLVFSNNRFFERGKPYPREDAWETIESAVEQYIATFLSIKEAEKYLHRILISGHTDSDGSLKANTQLSEQRALAVKKHLSELDIIQKNNLVPLLVSIGYANQFRVMKNGTEDKNASRRIEIDFQLDEKRIRDDINHLIHSNEI